MVMLAGASRDVCRRICPHCNKNVTFKTYKSHRRLFYDSGSDSWLVVADSPSTSNDTDEEPPTCFGEQQQLDQSDIYASTNNFELGKLV